MDRLATIKRMREREILPEGNRRWRITIGGVAMRTNHSRIKRRRKEEENNCR